MIRSNVRKDYAMPFASTKCKDTNKCIPLRKGLSAIASRKTGIVATKTDSVIDKSENTAAPKEISAAKCTSISMLAL